MINIRLTIAYDGANYLGWQRTDMGPSIEATLEKILSRILQENVSLQAASRTDAGVHANGQVINFITHKTDLSLSKLFMSLACLLPKSIAILDIQQARENFHPTLDCVSKEYHYSLCYGPVQMPQHRFYSWHYPRGLNVDKMRLAVKELIGERDFSAFCNHQGSHHYDHYMRILEQIDIVEIAGKRMIFKIKGNNFLYKMVRTLVGTLVFVGCGKIALESIPEILTTKQRPLAGITAPAHGLSLHQVNYGLTMD